MATATLRPNGVGDLTQLHYNSPDNDYTAVDEADPHDGDATYLYENGYSEHIDLYHFPSLHAGVGVVSGIELFHVARKSATGSAETRVLFKTNGTIYQSGLIYPTSSYTLYSVEWLTNPDTSNAWTIAEINALQGGLMGRAINSTPNSLPYITQFYIVVTYTEVTFIPKIFYF